MHEAKYVLGGEAFLNRKRKGNDFKKKFAHVKEEDFHAFFAFFLPSFDQGIC